MKASTGDMPVLYSTSYGSRSNCLVNDVDNTLIGRAFPNVGVNRRWDISNPAALTQSSIIETIQDSVALTELKQENARLKLETRKLRRQLKNRGKEIMPKRLVKIIIADPDENVCIENSLIYSSKEFVTDLDDTELYFDLDIKGLLAKHNKIRAETKDRKASEGKDVDTMLEPAKIRELSMTVLTIANITSK